MNSKGETREYWQPAGPIEKLEEFQGLHLRNTVERVYENSLSTATSSKNFGIASSDITKRD